MHVLVCTGSVCKQVLCLWAHVHWYRLYIGECLCGTCMLVCTGWACTGLCVCAGVCCWQVLLCTGVCAGEQVPVCALALHVSLCAHTGWARPGTWLWIHGSRYTAPCIQLLSHLGKQMCVCVCLCGVYVCVTTELCWLEWPLVLVAELNAQDRVGVCPLSCPHPHRVVTIPQGCQWCCQCCLCPHHAPEPPQLSPPLPARCRLASVAEMVRAQPRGRSSLDQLPSLRGQWWAVTQDSAGL